MLLKNKKLIKTEYILLVFVALQLTSCEEFLELEAPETLLAGENVYSSDTEIESALIGIYSEFFRVASTSVISGRGSISAFCGLYADEFNNFNSDNQDLFENSLNADTAPTNRFWSVYYRYIYVLNAIIEGAEQGNSLSRDVAARIGTEARFLRAYFYFYLANLYGAVPAVTTTDYRTNAVIARSSVSEIYNTIILPDLIFARDNFSDEYVNDIPQIRPNKAAASALLAKVYLYLENWSAAEAESSTLISSGLFRLAPLNDVFLIDGNELIWHIDERDGVLPTFEGWTYIIGSIPTFVSLSDDLIAGFEEDDNRLDQWVGSIEFNGAPVYFPFKYKTRFGDSDERLAMFRLGEQYLIRAEARAQQNNIAGAQADLNMIRNRAGLPNTMANDQNTLLEAIFNERRAELFTEFGNRWFDMKRTGRADAILGAIKPLWDDTDILWPVPPSEFQRNPGLGEQNPGY